MTDNIKKEGVVELDSTPDRCYNCKVEIERGWLCEIKVFIKTPLDGILKFKGEPAAGEPKAQNNKICPTCALIVLGVLNHDVLPPEKRQMGVKVL